MTSTLTKDVAEVGRVAREIVVKRLFVTSTVATGLNVLLAEHVVSVRASHGVTTYLGVGLNVLGVLVGALWSRDGTTPADVALAPVSSAGEALAPVAGSSARAARPAVVPVPASTVGVATAAFAAADAITAPNVPA